MLITTITTTERRTYVNGTTPEQYKQLIAEGFVYDRLSMQFRRSKTERYIVDDEGVARNLAS